MSKWNSLDARITSTLDDLSQKQRRLARFILDNKYFVSFASAAQVAEKVGVSAATVVRFAQSLDYEGFPELQVAIREELPSYLTAVERIQEQLAGTHNPATSELDSIPHDVFHTDIANIERTANSLAESDLEGVLEQILQAERILIVGSGISGAAVVFLAHSLRVMGFNTRSATESGLSLSVELAHLQGSSLMIAVDLYRYMRATVQAVQQARSNGVPIIAITDSIVSPVARSSDYPMVVATDGVAHSHSLVAVLSLMNVLIAALAQKAPERTVASLRRVDSAYRAGDLLILE